MTTHLQNRLPFAPFARALLALFAACALAFATLVALPGVAHAHDELVGTEPGQGSVVKTAPSEIQLQFNNQVLDVGTVIEVRDADGKLVSQGNPKLNGTVVTQPLVAGLGDGAYRVVWRVVSSDGHPIDGSWAFGVGANGKAALQKLQSSVEEETGQNEAHSSGSESSEHSGDTAGEHSESGHSESGQDESGHSESSAGEESSGHEHPEDDTKRDSASAQTIWLAVGIGVAGVAFIVLLTILLTRRSRTAKNAQAGE